MSKVMLSAGLLFGAGVVTGATIAKLMRTPPGRRLMDEARQFGEGVARHAASAKEAATDTAESVNEAVDQYMKEHLDAPPKLPKEPKQ